MNIEFEKFPKIPRLKHGLNITVSEKLDGTNGQIVIPNVIIPEINPALQILAGSRNRYHKWGDRATDNYDFALWVAEHAADLLALGHGRHYGEWYGRGINRGYDLDERCFALFNTSKPSEYLPFCVEQVPVLYDGEYQGYDHLMSIWKELVETGSHAHDFCGFNRPEGLVIWFHEMRTYMKMPIGK